MNFYYFILFSAPFDRSTKLKDLNMKTPLENKCVQESENQKLLTPYEGESKRSSIDSSNTITCGRSARSNSTNSTTISLLSTDDTKENKMSETNETVKNNKIENIMDHPKNKSSTPPEIASSDILLHHSNKYNHIMNPQDISNITTTRSTNNSPQRCKEKRNMFRMGSTLALSLDTSKMHHYPSMGHHKIEEVEQNRRNMSKQNVSRGFSPKKFISGKTSKSPTSNRKSIFSTSSKSNYNSLEEDHSRKSSMSSVGSGMGGDKDLLRKVTGVNSSSKYLTAGGRPLSSYAQSSPSSPTRGHLGKKSNLLTLSRATPAAFTSINIESTTSKSTSVSPKGSPSTKRSLFVSVQSPYKAVSMDDGHFHGPLKTRRNESISSSSSEMSSQSNLLQIPPSTSYKVNQKYIYN